MSNDIKLDPVGSRNYHQYQTNNHQVNDATGSVEQVQSVNSVIKDLIEQSETPMNHEKIASIKSAIEQGSYAFDLDKLADNIMAEYGLAAEHEDGDANG